MNITKEIAEEAYRLFKEHYVWTKTIRSIGIRCSELAIDTCPEQLT
ncbi:MAG TPA: hypothetical protein DEP72_01460 [Clostridiales bacterium]|nr:hypothetical protein [Clostridiales bacterium]